MTQEFWVELHLNRTLQNEGCGTRGALGVGVSWIAAGEFADEAVEAMDSAGLWQEHQGAFAGNDGNAALAANLDGVFADGALTSAPVHPDTFYASFGAVVDNGVCDCG